MISLKNSLAVNSIRTGITENFKHLNKTAEHLSSGLRINSAADQEDKTIQRAAIYEYAS